MCKKLLILFLLVLPTLCLATPTEPQRSHDEIGQAYGAEVDQLTGDTIYLAVIREWYAMPKMKFKNKRQEKFYWRTVRDVKKTLPYAKLLAKELETTSALMAKMNKKEQHKFWKKYEKLLFAQYEDDFRHMTASQGQMLMKLMDRESDKTSYELIRQYRGKASADFWQFVAKLFRNDLKEGYDGNDKDQIVERVINLVEAGQL